MLSVWYSCFSSSLWTSCAGHKHSHLEPWISSNGKWRWCCAITHFLATSLFWNRTERLFSRVTCKPIWESHCKTTICYGSACSVDRISLYFVHLIFDKSSFLFLKLRKGQMYLQNSYRTPRKEDHYLQSASCGWITVATKALPLAM